MAVKKKTSDSSFLDTKALGEYIRNDASSRVYLFFGEEEYYIEKAEGALKKKFLTEGSEAMDFVKLDIESKDFTVDKIRENAEMPPWMSQKRIVLVKGNSLWDKVDADELSEYVASVPDHAVIIFSTDKIDKRKKSLLKAFKDNAVITQIDCLDDEMLQMWIIKNFRSSGITISTQTAGSIVSRCDNSMRRVTTECEKIKLYLTCEKTTNVSDDLIERICPPDIKGSVFNITDAIGAGNAGEALRILDNLIVLKEPPIKIRFMLARHLRQLMCALELNNRYEIMNRLGVMQYVADKLLNQSRGFSLQRVQDLYLRCAKDDMEIKSGLLDDRSSLESFIVSACKRA